MDILFSNFWKTWLNLHFCRWSPVRLSIYLSVWPFASDIFLSGSTLDFVIILHQEILSYALERNKARFRLCVDSWGVANWVSKINLNQKQNICNLIPNNWLYDFVKKAYLGNIWFSSHRPKCWGMEFFKSYLR